MKTTLVTIAFAIATTTMFAAQTATPKTPATPAAPAATTTVKKPVKHVVKHSNKKNTTTPVAKPAPAVKPAPAGK